MENAAQNFEWITDNLQELLKIYGQAAYKAFGISNVDYTFLGLILVACMLILSFAVIYTIFDIAFRVIFKEKYTVYTEFQSLKRLPYVFALIGAILSTLYSPTILGTFFLLQLISLSIIGILGLVIGFFLKNIGKKLLEKIPFLYNNFEKIFAICAMILAWIFLSDKFSNISNYTQNTINNVGNISIPPIIYLIILIVFIGILFIFIPSLLEKIKKSSINNNNQINHLNRANLEKKVDEKEKKIDNSIQEKTSKRPRDNKKFNPLNVFNPPKEAAENLARMFNSIEKQNKMYITALDMYFSILLDYVRNKILKHKEDDFTLTILNRGLKKLPVHIRIPVLEILYNIRKTSIYKSQKISDLYEPIKRCMIVIQKLEEIKKYINNPKLKKEYDKVIKELTLYINLKHNLFLLCIELYKLIEFLEKNNIKDRSLKRDISDILKICINLYIYNKLPSEIYKTYIKRLKNIRKNTKLQELQAICTNLIDLIKAENKIQKYYVGKVSFLGSLFRSLKNNLDIKRIDKDIKKDIKNIINSTKTLKKELSQDSEIESKLQILEKCINTFYKNKPYVSGILKETFDLVRNNLQEIPNIIRNKDTKKLEGIIKNLSNYLNTHENSSFKYTFKTLKNFIEDLQELKEILEKDDKEKLIKFLDGFIKKVSSYHMGLRNNPY